VEKTINIHLTIGNRSDKPVLRRDIDLRVPNDGQYARVLHDWELPENGFKPPDIWGQPRQLMPNFGKPGYKRPLPSTRMLWGRYNGAIYDRQALSREWQFWLKELLAYQLNGRAPEGKIEYHYEEGKIDVPVAPNLYTFAKCTDGSLTWAYVNLIEDHRSFTDTSAPENGYADYVTGRNIGRKPYEWKCLTTTGNIVKILDKWDKYYVVEAFDFLKPPPLLSSVIDKQHLIHWATEQTVVKLPDKRWTVSMYPQIKVICDYLGLERTGTPFPLGSRGGTNLIRKEHVRLVSAGEKYSPYVPEQ